MRRTCAKNAFHQRLLSSFPRAQLRRERRVSLRGDEFSRRGGRKRKGGKRRAREKVRSGSAPERIREVPRPGEIICHVAAREFSRSDRHMRGWKPFLYVVRVRRHERFSRRGVFDRLDRSSDDAEPGRKMTGHTAKNLIWHVSQDTRASYCANGDLTRVKLGQ